MKLIACYIENFGNLSRREFSFSDGLNVLVYPNGWGKTTLTAFLRAMLYGLPASRGQDLIKNDRKRYQPWQGGTWGGSLTFEAGGKIYRAERTFANREADDAFRLYDAETGKPSRDFTHALGEELFGINATGYEQSVWYSDRATDTDHTSITSRLVQMQDFSDAERAEKVLDAKRREYQMTGGRGAIPEAESRLARLETELADCDAAVRESERLTRRAAEIRAEQAGAETRLQAIRSDRILAERAAAHTQLAVRGQELSAALDRAQRRADETRRYLSNHPPTPAELDGIASCDRRLQSPAVKRESAPTPLPPLAAAGGALLILFGVLLGRGILPLLICLTALGCGALAYAAVSWVRLRAKSRVRDEAVRQDEAEREAAQRELDAFFSRYPAPLSDPALHTTAERIAALRLRSGDLIRLEQEEAAARQAYDALHDEHPEAFAPVQNPADGTRYDPAEEARLGRTLNDLQEELMQCERDRVRCSAAAARRAACGEELADTEENLARWRKNLATVLKTQELLRAAQDNLRNRYLGVVNERFRHYVTLLSREEGTPAPDLYTVSPDFSLTLTSGGKTHPDTALNRGEREAIALCLQLALTDALFTAEQPPLILDDPFAYLDDRRTERGMYLLQTLAGARQILYLTCSAARAALTPAGK